MDKSVTNLSNVTGEVIEKEKVSQEKLNSNLMVDETGKTFSEASLKEKQDLCKDLEEKGMADEHDPVSAEKDYVQEELKGIRHN